MKTIPVEQFCISNNIPQFFIEDLFHYDLIKIIDIQSVKYIYCSEIPKIKKFTRLYYELEVNYQGIDIINHLLNQITNLKNEINVLQNTINFYE